MILLNRGIFKPLFIMLSTIFAPVSIFSILYVCENFCMKSAFIAVIIVAVYSVVVACTYRESTSTKYYLTCCSNFLEIKYPNVGDGKNELSIECRDVVCFEYYKASSLKSWLMLGNAVCPQCLFMTFKKNGINACKLIGYVSYADAKEIADICGAKLFVNGASDN